MVENSIYMTKINITLSTSELNLNITRKSEFCSQYFGLVSEPHAR
jgi:hypothetical protein